MKVMYDFGTLDKYLREHDMKTWLRSYYMIMSSMHDSMLLDSYCLKDDDYDFAQLSLLSVYLIAYITKDKGSFNSRWMKYSR